MDLDEFVATARGLIPLVESEVKNAQGLIIDRTYEEVTIYSGGGRNDFHARATKRAMEMILGNDYTVVSGLDTGLGKGNDRTYFRIKRKTFS